MEQNEKGRRICAGLLLLYGLVMVWLLFLQRQPAGLDYWTYVQASYNLRPFHTVAQMVKLLHHERLFFFALVNLAGNILLFVPLGLLPAVFPGQRRFGFFFLTTGGLILAVELLQLFTTLGAADVDDWLFNMAGACLGYGLWRILQKRAL